MIMLKMGISDGIRSNSTKMFEARTSEARLNAKTCYWMLTRENELDHFLLVLMKRDDLKCPSAILFSFFFFVIRLHHYAETSSTYYNEEVMREEDQKPAGKIYVHCNL